MQLGSAVCALALASRCAPPALLATQARRENPDREKTNRLLSLIEGTDFGVDVKDETRALILEAIEALEASWRGTDAFATEQRPYLLRRTQVAYVGQSSSKKANAAGGRYRGRIGRLIFRTEALFQHVLDEETTPSDHAGNAISAVNVIQFRLFGLIPGQAVLPGVWARATAEERASLAYNPLLARDKQRSLSANTVRVQFAPPRLCFGREGGALTAQLGPSSSVGLDTTYLDERLRICRGAGSGTPFVFRADTCADGAPLAEASRQWEQCVARVPVRKTQAVAFVLAAAAAVLAWPRIGALSVRRVLALPLLGAAALVLRSTGGIVVSTRRAASGDADPSPAAD